MKQLAIQLYKARNLAGDESGAEQGLQQWLEKHPKDIAANLTVASAYQSRGENNKAIALYERVIQISPKNVIALNNLAWLYQTSGDSRALNMAEKAYALAPESRDVMDTLGWIQINNNRLDNGIELLKKAADGQNVPPSVLYHLAVGLDRSGDKNGARDALQKIVSGNENFPERQQATQLLRTLK